MLYQLTQCYCSSDTVVIVLRQLILQCLQTLLTCAAWDQLQIATEDPKTVEVVVELEQ